MRSAIFQDAVESSTRVMGRKDVNVVFMGSDAKTDGDTVVLPALPAAAEISVEQADVIRGYRDHESMHVRCTDTSTQSLNRLALAERKDDMLGRITQYCEDIRIENAGVQEYAGMKYTLSALNTHAAKMLLEQVESKGDPAQILGMVGTDLQFRIAVQSIARNTIGVESDGVYDKMVEIIGKHNKKLVDFAKACADAMVKLPTGVVNGKLNSRLSKSGTAAAMDLAEKVFADYCAQFRDAPPPPPPDQPKPKQPDGEKGDGPPGEEGQPGGDSDGHGEGNKPNDKDSGDKPSDDKGRGKDGGKGDQKQEDGDDGQADANGDDAGAEDDQEAGDERGDESADSDTEEGDSEDGDGDTGEADESDDSAGGDDEGDDDGDGAGGPDGSGDDDDESGSDASGGSGGEAGGDDDEDGDSGDGHDFGSGDDAGETGDDSESGGGGQGGDDSDGENDGEQREPDAGGEGGNEGGNTPYSTPSVDINGMNADGYKAALQDVIGEVSKGNIHTMRKATFRQFNKNLTVTLPFASWREQWIAASYASYGDVSQWQKQDRDNSDMVMKSIEQSVSGRKAMIRRVLELELQAREDRRWQSGHKQGRLHSVRLVDAVQGRESVFQRRENGKDMNTVLLMSIDGSASMSGGNGRSAAEIAYALAEALERTGCDIEIVMWGNNAIPKAQFKESPYRQEDVASASNALQQDVEGVRAGKYTSLGLLTRAVIKSTKQRLMDPDVRYGLGLVDDAMRCSTPSWDAIFTDLIALTKMPHKKKVYLHLTDGQPNAPLSGQRWEDLIDEYKALAKSSGIHMIGVGVAGMNVGHLFSDHISVASMDAFEPAMRIVAKVIAQEIGHAFVRRAA